MEKEAYLIRQCKKKEGRAQRELYEIYKGKLMGIALRYTKCREDAEDIFQEAFVKIFKNIDQLKEEKTLFVWMKQIVIHTAINHFRQHQKYADTVSSDSLEAASDRNYENILSGLHKAQILEMINQLPDGYRLVFNLYVIDGYKHEEIARLLQISETTSRSQLVRAKQKLREMLLLFDIKKYEKHG